MGVSIESVFDQHCDRCTMTRSRVAMIKTYRLAFFNRNQDHFNFFTGNLLGVYPIRFRTQDRQQWFEEILEVDEVDLKTAIKAVDELDPSWHRANDVMNLSCVWLLYRCFNTASLSTTQRRDGLMNILLVLQYKFLSSIMAHYFPYPADESTALAAYEAMTRKFEIKRYGSWQALLEARAESILHSSSIHYHTYTRMDRDAGVVYLVNDVQQRLREIVKKYTALFMRVKDENLRITRAKEQIELDGELQLLDQTRAHSDYTRYLKDIISDQSTLIRDELVDVIINAVNTAQRDHLHRVLCYCADNYGPGGDPTIERLIDALLTHAYEFIMENKGVMASPSDLVGLLTRLKYLYAASRMSDPTLLNARNIATKLVQKVIRTRNSATLSATRNAFQLYLVLRAFSRKHFRG
jgi:hypothetical protein